jgi:hypothetical protein
MNSKNYALLIIMSVILASSTAFAQQLPQSYQSHGPELNKASKTTGIGSRNTGSSRWATNAGTVTPVDSQQNFFVSPSSPDISESFSYSWNAGVWTVYLKQEYTYSGSGLVSSIINKSWNSANNLFKENYRQLYTYKPDGYRTESSIQVFDTIAMAWVDASRLLYTPDSSNYTTEMLSQNWDTSTHAWVNYNRYNYLFNARHSTLEQLSSYWDDAAGAWRNSVRSVYTYDASGIGKIADTFYSWDINTGAWRYSGKSTYSVTATSKPDVMTAYNWIINKQTFDTIDRYSYSYDAADNQTMNIRERFSTTARTFSNFEKLENTYNSFDQTTSRSWYKWVAGAWSPISNRFNYYYENFGTANGIGHPASNGVEMVLSPLPARDRIDIRIGWQEAQGFTALITDMQGRVLQTFSGGSDIKFQGVIDISALPAGHYLMSIRGNKGPDASRIFSVVH